MASAWVTPWVQPDPCSERLAWFALRILPVCVCGRGSSQAACSLSTLPARRGTHLLPCGDMKKRNPVPTGCMPFERSVGKDARNTLKIAAPSSAPCLSYRSVNMPRGLAGIAFRIQTCRVDRCPALVGLSNARPLACAPLSLTKTTASCLSTCLSRHMPYRHHFHPGIVPSLPTTTATTTT